MPFSVYVIRLRNSVLKKGRFARANPNHIASKPCVYVGSTALTPEERYERQLHGNAGSLWVREFHIGLHKRLTDKQPKYATRNDAELAEFLLAMRLRSKGYAVWTNLPVMPPFYKETHFSVDTWTNAPDQFAIITAYATTGETWPDAMNIAADNKLRVQLHKISDWKNRITGYSPTSGHREPGWAAAIDFETACDLGLRFKQDAIYYVKSDKLCVSYCDARCALVPVGKFSERLHITP